MSENNLIERIAKLLRHAEKASTEEEAATYLQKAQNIATASAIDLEVARTHVNSTQRKPQLIQKTLVLGQSRKLGLSTYVELITEIGAANGVEFTMAHNSTYVTMYGYDTDIEVTEALYTSILMQMVAASDAYIRKGEYKTETVYRQRKVVVDTYKDWWSGEEKKLYDVEWGDFPVSGRTARVSFQNAFASRIGQRLMIARADAVEEIEKLQADHFHEQELDGTAPEQVPTGAALVLKEKGKTVQEYFDKNNNARGTWKGGRSAGFSSHAHSAGRAAGNSARLGGERAIGGSRAAVSA